MSQFNILLVEDNPGDVELVKAAFDEISFAHELFEASDGIQAINLLDSSKTSELVIDLIILDINIPKKNGHEVLRTIKTDDELKHIPVVILTSSSAYNDIKKAYEHYANCFVTKPLGVEEFLEAMRSLSHFWKDVALLPTKKKHEQRD